MFYNLLRNLLFHLPAETAHDLTLHVAKLAPWIGSLSGTTSDYRHQVKIGRNFWSNPIGLAAGLDKNADAMNFFLQQGFGCLECGTLTLHPQLGNPRPRIFRHTHDQSLRNAMGFPNKGLYYFKHQLRAHQKIIPIGINIGKNKDSSPTQSIIDLTVIVEELSTSADYFTINVSSPNTPGLRELQDKSYLTDLIHAFRSKNISNDLFLKISPDLSLDKINELGQLAADLKLTGIIATNTTINPDKGIGGISGNLLKEKASFVRKVLCNNELPIEIIGVGGISTPEDLFEFWSYGGKVVQIYTSYIYQGPQILKDFHSAINSFLEKNQLKDLQHFFSFPLEERKKYLLNRNKEL